MKSVSLLFLLIGISSIAIAEVKPAGAVLEDLCGALNREVEVCTAYVGTGQSRHTYLILDIFNDQTVFVPVETKVLPGPKSVVYHTGYGVKKEPNAKHRKYNIESSYQLSVWPDGNAFVGTLFTNGKKVEREFRMERRAHTESLQPQPR